MFWERFYGLCTRKGIKPNPIAKELGVSTGIISKWKNEKTLPNGETLIKIANYFNCSVDYLLGRETQDITPGGIELYNALDVVGELHISNNVALRIKAIAKEKHIPIGKMLSDCEISKNALSSMQAGGYLPRLENLIKIADYLNCSIDYLLGRDINEITPNGIELYNKLDPEDKAEIRGEIKQMLKADKYKTHYTLPPFEADKNNELKKAAMKTPSQPQVKKKPKTT